MNKAQRVLVLSALAVLAFGLHFWFCRWGWSQSRLEAVLTLYSHEPEPIAFDAADEGIYRFVTKVTEWREILGRTWDEMNPDADPERRKQWVEDAIDAQLERTGPWHFGLWATRGGALVGGVFAPLGVIALGVFLVLGWRSDRTGQGTGSVSDPDQ